MADSRTIRINLKAVSDFSDVVNNAKQLQGIFGELKLPDNLKSSLDKIFADIEKNGEKASQAMTNGFKTKGDVSNFERSINNINTSMERLVQTTSKMDSNLFASGDLEKEIKAVDNQIKSLQQDIDKLSTSKMTEVTNAFKESEKFSKAGSWKQFFDAFQQGSAGVEEAEKAFNRLQAEVEKAKAKLGDKAFSESDKWQNYAKQVNVFAEALTYLKGESEEARQKKIELDAAFAKKDALHVAETEQAAKAHRDVTAAIEKERQEVSGLGKETLETAESTQHINSELDHFKSRIAYFFGAANAVNLFKRAIRSAFETVKDLDKVMTETAVVTQFSVAEMWEQLPDYTKRANELGVTIHDAYESATIYYQQGLKTNQVMEVSNQTLKMARIAGLDAAEATDRMTNALRGFNMEINEVNAERVADVYSKLAAISASNVDEISTAMTKVASLANNANMEFETTAAFLSQIIETTRESAETAGTALKTVVARFSEVKELYSKGELLGTDAEGQEIDVNRVSIALRSAGINLNEYLAGMKGLDDIFLELASKWDSLDNAQQRYIATMAAGSRQQSRFIAMMQDYGRTQELVNAAYNAGGASNEQYQKTLDSLESKLNQLKNAWDEFLMGITNNAIIKSVVYALTGLLNIVNSIISGLSKATGPLQGFTKSFLSLGAVIGGLKLGKGIFNKLLGNVGAVFLGKGKEAGTAFSSGFSTTLNKMKAPFTKNFWVGITKIPKIDTTSLQQARLQLDNVNKAYSDGVVNITTRQAVEENYKRELTSLMVTADLTEDQISSMDLMMEYGISADTAAAMAKKGLTRSYIEQYTAGLIASGVSEEEARAKTKEMLATLGLKTAEEEENITTKKGVITKLASIVNAKASSVAKNTETGSIWHEIAALVAEKTAVEASTAAKLAALGVIGLIIAAVIALIAIIAVFIKMVNNNTPEAKMQRLHEETLAAAEAAQKANEAYSQLTSNIDKYDQLNRELDELTTGTNAWNEKLKEVNQQVLDLIENFPELAQYLSVDSNGKLTIDAERIEEVKNRAEGQRNATQAMASMAAADERLYTGVLDEQRASLENSIGTQYRLKTNRSASNEQVVAAIRAYVEDREEFNKSDNDVIRTFREWLNAGTIDASYLTDNYSKLKGLELDAGSRKQAEGQITAAIDTMSSSFKDEIDSYYGSILSSISSQTADVLSAETDAGIHELTGEKGLQKLYQEKFGHQYSGDWQEATKKLYIEIFGGTLEDLEEDLSNDKIDIEDIQKRIVQSQIAQKASDRIKKIYELGIQQQVAAVLNPENALSYTEEELDKIDPKAILKSIDYEGEELQQLIDNYKFALEQIRGEIQANFERLHIESGQYSGLTLTTQKELTEQMLRVQERSGESGVGEFSSILQEAQGNMPTAEFEKFIKAINLLDVSSASDIELLSDSLEAVGVDASKFDLDINDLEKRLISAARAVREFKMDNVREQLKKGLDFADELRSRESYKFNDEEVKEMINTYGIDASNFEYNGQDWIYVGGTMEALSEAVRENTLATVENNRALLERKIQSGQELADIAQANNLSDVGREHFLSGEFSTAGFRNLLTGRGIESITDSATGQTHDVSEIDDTLLKQIYSQMVSDYQNLDTNKGLLEGYGKSTGQNTGKEAEALIEAETFGLDMNAIATFQQTLQQTHNLTEEVAANIAVMNAKMNEGLSEVRDSYEEWNGLIDENTGLIKISSADDAKSFNKLSASVNKMLNTSKPLSKVFWENAENMELIQKAADGDVEALGELQVAATQDYLMQVAVEADTEEAMNAILTLSDFIADHDFPALEPGVDLSLVDEGAQKFIERCNELIAAGKLTSEQVSEAFKGMGYDVDFEPNYQTVDEVMRVPVTTYTVSGSINDGTFTMKPNVEIQEFPYQRSVPAPTIKTLTSAGSAGGGVTTSNSAPRASSGGGGGGGGGGSTKEEKPSYWENPYDELYNLSEKINESMRTREALERAYDKLLQKRSTSSRQIIQNSLDEVALLRQQLDYQRQMEAGRRRQLEAVGSQMYTDEEGNRTSFSDLGVTKYASYDFNSGLIQIDWSGLEEIANDASREEEGKQAEAYISKLEELVEQYEDVRDAVWEIEDTLEEVQKRGMGEYLELEERVYNALVEEQQRIIDSFDAMSQAIEEATSKVLDDVREQIDAERQQRQNEKTEEEISDKEARLAYLSRDTSGANQLETMKLQKEIDDARQNYSDSLVDQAIDEMRKDADLAAEQRAQQLKIMQAQLDIAAENGEFWPKVEELLRNSFTSEGNFAVNANLTQLLEATEAFKGMSEFGKQNWINEITEAWLKAIEGRANWEMKKAQDEGKLSLANGTQLNYKNGKWVDAKGNTYSDVAYDTKSGAFTGKSNNDAPKAPAPAAQSKPQTQATPAPKTRSDTEVANRLKAMFNLANTGQVGAQPQRHQQWMAKGYSDAEARAAQEVIELVFGSAYGLDNAIKKVINNYGDKLRKYADGGMADYTGLAWLDGSRSKPEAILSAQDTKNFISLRDILAQFMGVQGANGIGSSGDNYFNIDINAEIGSDYDVDRLAERIKQQIYNDSTYRNVNAINFIR